MAKNAIYTVKYRRKREGRTHYKKRLELLKSGLPRLVIRRSNTSITLQLVNYHPDGDKVLVTFNSKKLSSFGWEYSKKSIPASYLAGLAFAKLAKEKKVNNMILDLGLQTPKEGSKIYAALKGVVDGGIIVPCSTEIFPTEERLSGNHIAQLGDQAKQCTAYQKAKLSIEKLPEAFQAVKKKILA